MIMCVLLCYPVSIRTYYQQGVLFLVLDVFLCQLTLWHHCGVPFLQGQMELFILSLTCISFIIGWGFGCEDNF